MRRNLRRLNLGLLVASLALVSAPLRGEDGELWKGGCLIYHEFWVRGGAPKFEILAGVGVFVAPDIVLTTAGLHPSESYGPNFGHDKDEIVFLTVKPYGSNRSYKTKVIVRKPGGHDLMLLKVEGYCSPKFFRLTTKVEGGERVTILAVRVTKSQFFGEEIFTPQKVSGYIPDAKLLDDFWDIRQSILFCPPLEINKNEGAPIINSEGKVVGVFVGQNLRFRNIVTGEKTPVFGVAERVDSVIPYLQKIRQSQSRRGR